MIKGIRPGDIVVYERSKLRYFAVVVGKSTGVLEVEWPLGNDRFTIKQSAVRDLYRKVRA